MSDPIDANVILDESNVVTDAVIDETAVDETVTPNVATETATVTGPVITIVRYELYPREEPTCYCVGFSATCPRSGRSMYRDTQVPLDTANTMTETEVAQEAYTAVKDSFDSWMCDIASKPSILGSQFVPN